MKIGVVGLGSIGARHYQNLKDLGQDVKGYDPVNPMGRADFKHHADIYDWCDAAVICTPSQYHEGPLRACIERGKHVLVEKPISVDIGGLPALLDAADEKGLVVMMGNNLRFHPCVRQAKRWIEAERWGKPIWAHFMCCTEPSATADRDGVILNTGAHEVDVALHLFGDTTFVIHAHTGLPEKVAHFLINTPRCYSVSFHIDICTPLRIRKFWIAFEKKTLEADLDQFRFVGDDMQYGFQYRERYDDGYVKEMKAFLARVNGEPSPGATGREGLETLKLLLQIRKAAGL